MAATVVAYVPYAKNCMQMSRMRNRLACATGSVPKINNKYFALPMHTSQALLNVSATVNAVELEFTFRSICLLMCLETGAYSECRMMRSIVSNHSHMVRIFSVRILAVGSHRQFAVCGSHFRVRQFAVRILEQPNPNDRIETGAKNPYDTI